MSRRISLLLLLVCTVFLVAACSADYSGQYGGLSDAGIFVSMVLNKDGTVETNLLGIPVTGTYTLKNDQITVKLTTMGYSQSVQGRITKDTIEFSDVILKKGVTSVDISEVSSLLGGTSESRATATPTAQVTTKPTKSPQSEAEAKLDEAEQLFASGYYDEAIAIYNEIASIIDVEDRRAYAVECRDIRDLHFTWKYKNGQLVLTEYVGYGLDTVIIPYGVCALEDDTFEKSNLTIKEVQLPDTLTQIPYGCFSGCPNLIKINIPASINSIALNGTGITELVIPKTVTAVPSGAFANCTKLKTVVFEGAITVDRRLATGLFEGCSSLESVTLHNDFQEISYAMFRNCIALQMITLPSGITKIDEFAFYGCSSLEGIVLNDNITSIGRSSFENCTSLQAISWPTQCPVVSEYVLRNCSALSEVTLPETITSIEARAFEGCNRLTSISIPGKTKDIHWMAFGDGIERIPATMYVAKGSFAHRYCAENHVSYLFKEYNLNNLAPLWSTLEIGTYKDQALEWMILSYCGDQYIAVSKFGVAELQMNTKQEEVSWENTIIKRFLDTDFAPSAFNHDEMNSIRSVSLLPYGFEFHYVNDRNIDSYFCKIGGEEDGLGWLLMEEPSYSARYAGRDGRRYVDAVGSVHPVIYIGITENVATSTTD